MRVWVLLLMFLAPFPAVAETPPWLERWLWNPVERTARGIEAFAAGDPAAAVAPLATARRLAPESPVAAYNAGTARFAAGEGAVEVLGSAARGAGPALAPAAWYNLGTAQLAAGDLEAAIAALEEALRRAPGMADAKHNLELARGRQQEQAGEDGAERGEPPPGGEPQDEEPPPPPPEGGEQEQQENPAPGDRDRQRPLPQFRDLPDMTAEEAAAILQAIENLEREERRRAARQASPASAGRRKDW